MKNKIILTVLGLIFFVNAQILKAQDQPLVDTSNPLTQEQFAVELVKILKLEERLPLAALPRDSVNLLDSYGIAPLSGWKNKDLLKQEDYLVVIGKAQGKEELIHDRAIEVEKKNREIINDKWQQAYDAKREWPSLEELLNDKSFFPNGAPKSPYGVPYHDKNRDHRVDAFVSPINGLIDLRETLATR